MEGEQFRPVKVTLTWFSVCNQRSFVSLCTQDYRSLCAVVKISAMLVNIHTHKRFDHLIW